MANWGTSGQRSAWFIAGVAAVAGLGTVVVVRVLLHDDRSLAGPVINAVVAGVVVGVIGSRANRRAETAVGGELSRSERRQAGRAAQRGPAPSDPRIRAAALAYLQSRLALSRTMKVAGPIIFGLAALLFLYEGTTDDPGWLLGAAFMAGLAGLSLWTPGHLRRRIAVLDAANRDAADQAQP